jgi:prefoldin subunit 5
MSRVRLSLIAFTVAMALLWVLMERTFVAIGDGLDTAVEVSRVSADAATSIEELSGGLSSLIGSVDELAGNAQSLSNDAATASDSVADAASGSVGDSLTTLSRTAERLAPVVRFVEGLSGGRGAAKDLEELSKSLKPIPAELDRIATNLEATGKSLRNTGSSLDRVKIDLREAQVSVDKGKAALAKLPVAARSTEAAAQRRLDRLQVNLWLWRGALAALWLCGCLALLRRKANAASVPV